MNENQKGELRLLALNAKRRMKDGYWQKTNVQRINAMENMRAMGKSVMVAQNYYINKLSTELYGKSKIQSEDDNLYRKVCKILDDCSDVTNPIGLLVDREVYDKLDSNAKQRYVFKLADKYRTLKERYYMEKQMCSK